MPYKATTVATTSIDDKIASNSVTPMYSVLDHVTPTYTRNPACWAKDININWLSPWNTVHAHTDVPTRCAGCLITRKHVLAAHHYSPEGDIRFKGDNGTIYTATIVDSWWVGSNLSDLQVLVLGAEINASVPVVKILPSNWRDYFPNDAGALPRVPLLATDQERKALVYDAVKLANADGSYGSVGERSVVSATPTDVKRLAVHETLISGDSGCPMCLVLEDEPVLVSLDYGSAKSVHQYRSEINAGLALAGAYSLSEFDLSVYGRLTDSDPIPEPVPVVTAIYPVNVDWSPVTGAGYYTVMCGQQLVSRTCDSRCEDNRPAGRFGYDVRAYTFAGVCTHRGQGTIQVGHGSASLVVRLRAVS